MKHLNQFITEYIVKKKLDKFIDSEDHYEYFPKSKEELIYNIKKLIKQDIYNFNCIDTSAITDMSNLFKDLYDKLENNDFDVSKWNVSNVTDMKYLFAYCKKFNGDLSKWNVSNVTNMMGMFGGCESFEGKGIENWDVSKVEIVEEMFCACLKLNTDFSNLKLKKIYSTENMFYNCIEFEGKGLEKWDVSNIVNMSGMFQGCRNLDCYLSKWNISKVKNMQSMFYECINFTGKGLENWNISNVKSMVYMFYGCYNFNCDNVKNWKVNDSCNISAMFNKCTDKPDWYEEKINSKRLKYTL